MNVVMTGAGHYGGGAGHGRGRGLFAQRDGSLLSLAEKGIAELVLLQQESLRN